MADLVLGGLGGLISTIAFRPYVFLFLGAYLLVAVAGVGVARAAIFTLVVWVVAFLSELSSIHNGFPFGLYTYLPSTVGKELWIAGIPFMDSLSFTFLAFASYATALLLTAPRWAGGREERGPFGLAHRGAWGVLLLAAGLFVLIDVVVDPVALRGDRWFLGKIFSYPDGGIYFGVPLSNFAGWGFVGLTSLSVFRWADRALTRAGWPLAPRALEAWAPAGTFLYYLILAFNLAVTYLIGETALGIVGTLLHLPAALVLAARLSRALGPWTPIPLNKGV